MAKLIFGERISGTARLRPGCSAAIFDSTRQKILLQKRSDNGRWCFPGGAMDPGESAAEACEREIREETGLEVRVTRLIGVYSDPDCIVEYADGNRWQVLSLHFEVEVVGGELTLDEETLALDYFSPAEIEQIDLMEHHRVRVPDTFAQTHATFIR